MVEVQRHLLLMVLGYGVNEFDLVSPPIEVLFLLVLEDDLSTDLALSGVAVTLHGVSSCVFYGHLLLAVGTGDEV